MFHYSKYAGNAEPVGWALRQSGHGIIAAVIQAISVIGMFTALIGMMLAGSRLLYSFGRDGLLPPWLSKLNHKHLPNRALLILTIIGVLIGSMFPFAFLAQLISAGTLVAFMFVSLAMYRLRKREGKDLPEPSFKVPFFPVLPIITFILVLLVFWGLSFDAKLYTLIWFVVGIIIYLSYGVRHSKKNEERTTSYQKINTNEKAPVSSIEIGASFVTSLDHQYYNYSVVHLVTLAMHSLLYLKHNLIVHT